MKDNQIDYKSRLVKLVNWNFISECDIAMKLTSSDMSSDYAQLVGYISHNGLPGATWDQRHTYIWEYAKAYNLKPFVLDRKIWTACVVLDEQEKVLYAFTSSQNYKKVLSDIKNGKDTHYYYLLCLGSDEPVLVQTSFFDSDKEQKNHDAERMRKAKELLKEWLDLAEHFVVVHYEYRSREASDGTISLLDNNGAELTSIKIGDHLKEKVSGTDATNDDSQSIPESQETFQEPLVSWKETNVNKQSR